MSPNEQEERQAGAISSRKDDHLELCARDAVEARARTTLLEEVELMHDSLPEVALGEVDVSVTLFGQQLSAPLLITGMTGGAPRAREINRHLAQVAQELGLALGLGSQRAILKDPALAATYQVRDLAPDIVLLGNIGAVQAAQMTTQEAEDLVGVVGANALCVHLNPGQELIQPEGDRDFRGCVEALRRLNEELSVPVMAKETGCGMSRATLGKIRDAGIRWVDVSGIGGTTWIGVEALRTPPAQRDLGQLLWDWGVPTAVSIAWAKGMGLHVVGSGGLRTGLDAARAIALGADIAGMALPWLRAVYDHGPEEAVAFGQGLIHALRVVLVLTGSQDVAAFKQKPVVLGPTLQRWIAAGG